MTMGFDAAPDAEEFLNSHDFDGARKRLLSAQRAASSRQHPAQCSLLDDEIAVDLFAGAGGASLGLAQALGVDPAICINHDSAAIACHKLNHLGSEHYTTDVFEVDPLEATRGRRVGILWMSPTCTHFSVAKGGAPLNYKEARRIRGLAWVGIRWAKKVRPRMVITENVDPFRSWARLGKDGRVDKTRIDRNGYGEYFKKWVRKLRRLGYEVEWRVLSAADYGAPTIRRRLFVLARCDGLPIVWPEPTHGPGYALPHRTAAECIDWNLPTHSIFDRAKPLAANTLKRIAKGVVKYVLMNPKPFIVRPSYTALGYDCFRGQQIDEPLGTVLGSNEFALVQPEVAGQDSAFIATLNHQGEEFRGQGVYEPMKTLTAARNAHGLVIPHITRFRTGTVGSPITAPLNTITSGQGSVRPAGHAHAMGLVEAEITKVVTMVQTGYGEREGQLPRALELNEPLGTVVAGGVKHAVVEADIARHSCLVKYYRDGGQLQGVEEPLHTIPTKGRFGLVETETAPAMAAIDNKSSGDGAAFRADEPRHTATSGGGDAVVMPVLVGAGGQKYSGKPRAMNRPMGTILMENHSALVETVVSPSIMTNTSGHPGASVEQPLPTLTTGSQQFLTETAFIAQQNLDAVGRPADEPLATLTKSGSQQQVVTAHLTNFYSSNTAGGEGDLTSPMTTVTSRGQHQGLVTVELSGENLKKAQRVARFLKRYYVPGKKEAQLTAKIAQGIVTVNGIGYQIIDLKLRMLAVKELKKAQGFPDSYRLDAICEYRTRRGKRFGPLPQSEMVAKIGNSVCPPIAKALVEANLYHEHLYRMPAAGLPRGRRKAQGFGEQLKAA